jgi:hypothetical protein
LLWFALVEDIGADEFDFMLEFVVDVLAGLTPEVFAIVEPEVELVAIVLVVATGAGVLAGATFAGLVLALLAGVSPQAMPNAPITNTAESAITFFICLQTPILSQRLI